MTETASQQAERIFKKAAIIARFPFGDGWPEYFSHEQLAALMAGGPEDAHPVDFLYWRKVIADATGPAGSLKFKDEVSKTIEPVRWNLANERPTFAGMPARLVYMCQRTGETFSYCFIDREACTVWLRAIGETPNEYVLAWLGPAWKKKLGKISAPEWISKARAIGEKWMLDQEKITSKRPTVAEIARYLEGELSNRGITGPRGKYLDSETIKREALTGITGRKRGDNLRR